MAAIHLAVKAPPLRQQVHWTDRLANVALLGTVALLCIGLLAPLLLILSKALDAPEAAPPPAPVPSPPTSRRRRCCRACGTACGCRCW
jgi:hypothetical protein